jgi:hypothetical protein
MREYWSKSDQGRLEELAASGVSASVAARALETTRNAILGRAFRTGVKFNGASISAPKRGKYNCAFSKRGHPRGARSVPHNIIIQAVALHLAGIGSFTAAKPFGVSPHSVRRWAQDPEIHAEASPIAQRAKAETEAVCAMRRQREEERVKTRLETAARVNQDVFRSLPSKHVAVLRAYVEIQNMAAVAPLFGVSRERIRQIVVAAERKGFIAPTEIGRSHRRHRRAA